MSELRRIGGLGSVVASDYGVLLAGFRGPVAALLRGGAVTLGRSFMVISGGCMCIFWHLRIPSRAVFAARLQAALVHEGAQTHVPII